MNKQPIWQDPENPSNATFNGDIFDDYCEIDGVSFTGRQATIAMDLVKERDSLNQQIDRLYQRIPYCLMLCIDLINELTPEKRQPFQNRLNKVWPTPPNGKQTDGTDSN